MTSKPGSQIKQEEQEIEKKTDKPYRKIAIIGSATTTLGLMPWHDFSLEVWGLAWRAIPRANRLFDMHPGNFDKSKRKNVQENYEQRLAALETVPIYLCEVHPEIPNSVKYPLEEILNFIGPELDPYSDGQYFASSIAWMIILAIYEKVDEIYLFGIDFIGDGEYGYQKPNMEYLIGVARGKGIKVFIAPGSALLEFSYLYGYQLPPDEGLINRAVIMERMKKYKDKQESALLVARTSDGAIQECEQLLSLLVYSKRGGKLDVPPIKEPVEVQRLRLQKEKEESHE